MITPPFLSKSVNQFSASSLIIQADIQQACIDQNNIDMINKKIIITGCLKTKLDSTIVIKSSTIRQI